MSYESEPVLRKSLDAVDRHRKRLLAAAFIIVLPQLWAFHTLANASQSGDVRRMILAAVVILCFWSVMCVFVVVFQLTIATRRILRAIELATRSGN
jgi:hypothetical protein